MGFSRWQIALVIFVTSVAAPLGMAWWLLGIFTRSGAELFSAIAVCGVWTLALVLANWWEFTSVHLRWVWLALIAGVSAVRLTTLAEWPLWGGTGWHFALAALVGAIGVAVVAFSVGGRRTDADTLPATFPFAGGTYLVTDGGDGKRAPLTNYHYGFGTHRRGGVSASMRFATDIVAIGPAGAESRGLLPRQNSAYRVWEREVLAPLDGEVVHVIDDVADNSAFGSDRPYGVGNQVVIRAAGDVYVVLGHLRQGSVEVSVGQQVSPGDVVGRAGNSGWTERPHLHMQAMRAADGDWWHGEPIALTFGGRLLVRNDVRRA